MTTTTPPHLGERLAFAMDRAHMSRAPVAAACNVSRQAVTIWRRTGRIHRDHLPKLAKLFGVPLEFWYDPEVRLDAPRAIPQIRVDADFPFLVAQELTNRHVSQDAARLLLALIRSLPERDSLSLPRLDSGRERRSGGDRRGESATAPEPGELPRFDRRSR